jgi:hypothetical protein
MFGALLVLLLTGRSWADLAEGLNAYYKGDWATAVREFRTLAEQGDAPAQYKLGTMYLMGFGVPQDHAQSKHWFGLAAEQGFAPTPELAPEMLIRIAAERGDADYQYQLGDMYLRGKGFIGEDVPQDYAQAVHWFGLAAEQGDKHSQYKLGAMYAIGKGIEQDDVSAHMWLNLAAAQGDDDAQKGRDLIAKQMPAAKIAKAQHRARICLLQQRLKDFREDPGPCDGIMGIKTHAALRAFQRKRGLPVTGEPDEGTLKLLGLH